jgi:hypothetical protein
MAAAIAASESRTPGVALNVAYIIQPNHAATVLAQINPENRDLHCLLPPNRLSEEIMSSALRRGAPSHKGTRRLMISRISARKLATPH